MLEIQRVFYNQAFQLGQATFPGTSRHMWLRGYVRDSTGPGFEETGECLEEETRGLVRRNPEGIEVKQVKVARKYEV